MGSSCKKNNAVNPGTQESRRKEWEGVGQGFVLHFYPKTGSGMALIWPFHPQSNAHQLTQENKKVAGFTNCSGSYGLARHTLIYCYIDPKFIPHVPNPSKKTLREQPSLNNALHTVESTSAAIFGGAASHLTIADPHCLQSQRIRQGTMATDAAISQNACMQAK